MSQHTGQPHFNFLEFLGQAFLGLLYLNNIAAMLSR
jgi:dsRNA-specific ribonuclease